MTLTADRTVRDASRQRPAEQHLPRFYLGSHRPRWLESSPVPLFISAHTLARYRGRGDAFPKARCPGWALDSGGFTELSTHGEWTISADEFGGMVYRFMDETGQPPAFCAPQDWMCEEPIRAKTGRSTYDHQQLTTANVLYLRDEFPAAPWIPVLQGQSLDEYEAHAAAYEAAGVDLVAEPLVGLGSVCRRQSTAEIGAIVATFAARGIKLHGFGVKTEGLRRYGHMLASADSLAWSYRARAGRVRLAGCTHRGPCQNCLTYALQWREQTLAAAAAPKQLDLFAA